ncbi:hypothetical protein SRS16P1_00278 (plasmid) [Variovorax sp. SRS16]|nr:hypothetical protein SRS16P1_00278 [Variovorax sp. SRS16]
MHEHHLPYLSHSTSPAEGLEYPITGSNVVTRNKTCERLQSKAKVDAQRLYAEVAAMLESSKVPGEPLVQDCVSQNLMGGVVVFRGAPISV